MASILFPGEPTQHHDRNFPEVDVRFHGINSVFDAVYGFERIGFEDRKHQNERVGLLDHPVDPVVEILDALDVVQPDGVDAVLVGELKFVGRLQSRMVLVLKLLLKQGSRNGGFAW